MKKMIIFAYIRHFYQHPLVVFLRIVIFASLLVLIFTQTLDAIFPKFPLFCASLLCMWEVYVRFAVLRTNPPVTVSKNNGGIYDSFTVSALEESIFIHNTAHLATSLVKKAPIQFLLQKADIDVKDIHAISLAMDQVAQKAFEMVASIHGTYVTPLDLFAAYLMLTEPQTHVLFSKKIKQEELLFILYWARLQFPHEEIAPVSRVIFWGEGIGEEWVTGWTLETKRYILDLTNQVLSSPPHVLGRDTEFTQLVEGLSKENRNNVMLVGEVGSGKTALVEELALNSFLGFLSGKLYHKRIYQLQVGLLVAGAKDVGTLEERLEVILEELMHAGNIILFIPDVQNIIGSSSYNINLTATLLPILKNGNIPIIASALPHVFQTIIQSQQAFADLFEIVHLEEPTRDEAIQMLLEKAQEIEKTNKVSITYKAVIASVDLASRYIQGKVLPGSAVGLLSSTASMAKAEGRMLVEESDVTAKIEAQTHISVAAPGSQETALLLHLEQRLHESIVDQDEAVNAIAQAIRRLRTGLTAPKRPISFLFLGPTGVGKTETAKTLGQVYFGGENKIIRLDMSEYTARDSVDRLLGSAPGQGNEKGELTEKVYEHPFSLILLDEFEKAHPEILDLFLQVLEDGRLTDNQGKTVSFADTIIIATSNAGSLFIQNALKQGQQLNESFRAEVLEEVEKEHLFKPELLNRFDGIIIFKPLSKTDMQQIAKLYLAQLQKQLQLQDVRVNFDQKIVDLVAASGFDQQFGARPLRRFMQDRIEDPIAKELLEGKIARGSQVTISTDQQGNITFLVS